jgi:radical SAM-linked protein
MQRACKRAGLQMVYSEGFNPRPKISLVLPRPVGVQSEEDLMLLQVQSVPQNISATLQNQLPSGCEVYDIAHKESNKPSHPISTIYTIPLKSSQSNLQEKINKLLDSESIIVYRQHKKGRAKNKEVRDFIEYIELKDNKIAAKCRITGYGSIRVDELMRLLDIKTEDLDGAIKRSCTEFSKNI